MLALVLVHLLVHPPQFITACELHFLGMLPIAPGEGPVLRHPLILTALVHAVIQVTLNLGSTSSTSSTP
jgi:hypothetical protein